MTPEPVTVAGLRRLAARSGELEARDDVPAIVLWTWVRESAAALSAAADEIGRLQRVWDAAQAVVDHAGRLSTGSAEVDSDLIVALGAALAAAATQRVPDARAGEPGEEER
jgi:hypothetical protein